MSSDRVSVVRAVRRIGVLGALLLATACSSDDGDTGEASTSAPSTSPTTTEPLFTPADDDSDELVSTTEGSDDSSPSTDPPAGTDVVTTAAGSSGDGSTTLPTVPDTGVPGIDSSDVFCRAWSQFGGTFQGLAISWGVGDPTDAALNEVAASGAILGAVDDLDANLPAELEAERADLMALVDPLAVRATAARDELLAAGVSEDGLTALGEAWLETLTEVGTDDPAILVVVPSSVDAAAVEAAAAAFADGRQSLVEDPSMISGAETPETEAYLVANCPDQGTLLGNDDVEGAP